MKKTCELPSGFVRVLAALFFCLAFTLQAQTPTVVRIMPVGDSITDGSSYSSPGNGGPGGGYRRPLWLSLTNAGYNVDYVGLLTINPATDVPMPTHHEGHSGWKIDQIYSNMVNAVFGNTEDPDVLLIMIGTNDFGGGYDVNNATNRINQLIGLVTTRWPYCKVIVASLTRRGAPYEANIQTNFNNSLPGIVSNYQAVGKQVYFTDMHSAVPLSDFPDSLHPNTNGYVKMATNWFPAITNVISPQGTTNAPEIKRLSISSGFTNVYVTFSKPVDDATATNIDNYFINGGLTILGASLEPVNKRDLILTTTPMALHTFYTLIITGVVDRTASATMIDITITNFQTYGASVRGVYNNVPEAGDYRLVYSLNIPNAPNYSVGITYDTDLHACASNFTRVAYYLEVQPAGGALDYAWVSFDAMTTNITQIGVPTFGSGANFQMTITNMNVLSSMPSILNGTNMTGGNIEFWPSNYTQVNAAGVPNASAANYDWGDQESTSGNYGSMQVHNHDASQTIFAFNDWNKGVNTDLGIGNDPTNAATTDWTFANNGSAYTVKVLQVFAKLASNTPPLITSSYGLSYSTAQINFSIPVADDATDVTFYAVGGLSVSNVVIDTVTRQTVTLVTSMQTAGVTYTAVVNNVHDRASSNSAVIVTNTLATFQGPAVNGAFNNVLDATNYSIVYSLNISNGAAYNTTGVPYDLDLHNYIGAYSRIAYYMELQTATGLPSYIWVALDPFTTNAALLGVPAKSGSPIFQQYVSNMTVQSSVAGIVQGNGITTGNMEFWPWDYTANNTNNIPGASNTAFDWGDSCSSNAGGHACMQIHNYSASQTLFAFNNWGAAAGGTTAVGIGKDPNLARANYNPDWTFAANATNYIVKTLQVYALPVSNVAPSIISVIPQSFSNVMMSFSKPLDDGSIVLTNFSIGGLTVLSATLDPVTKTRVALITSPQTPSMLYTSVVSNVRDRTASAAPIAPNSSVTFRALPVNGVYNNVPEAVNYNLVYSLNIPAVASYAANGASYDVDAHTNVGTFSRIAYYLELQPSNGPVNFVWVSLDPFSTDAGKIGIPTTASGALFQQNVTNMTVISSVTNIVQGAGIATGNMEFWPWSYGQNNTNHIPNASSNTFDWGDAVTIGAGAYGSMQFHNYGASQVLFGFNNWGGGGNNIDVGMGNNTTTVDADWTHTYNATGFSVKVLQVFTLPSSNSPPLIAGAFGQLGFSNVVVTFNKALDDSAAAMTNFTLSGGVTVLSAVLDPVSKARITLATTPQLPFTVYTVTVNNLRDRTTDYLQIAPNSTIQFRTVAGIGALANVPEAASYQLVYSISLPAAAQYANSAFYDVDLRNQVTNFTRVAYYLELQTNSGPVSFAWTAFDAPTNNINAIGIPTVTSGAILQQPVTNMTVISSVANIVSGTNMSGGNVEFWPSNYGASNAMNVANASSNNYDWGDVRTGGNYGSMQVHNHDANLGVSTGQVIWAFNHWGGAGGNDDIGIGNNPGSIPNTDWTFANNAPTFTARVLQVYALSTTNLPPVVIDISGQPGLSNVVIQFSKPLADTAATLTNFTISGLTIVAASLDVTTRTRVTLTTSPQAAETFYTLTITGGIQDRTAGSLPLSGGPSYNFMSAPRSGVYNNIAEAAGYTLVYSLNVSTTGNWSASTPPYSVDNHFGVTNFTRIGYYLELQKAGVSPSFVWATMDPFTLDTGKIGVPTTNTLALFQQPVTNLSVFSSVYGVLSGTNMSGGNIEFWPNAYVTTNNAGVPNASGATFDWGDQPTAGNYGSMQIHNSGASQVVFAFNNWGTANIFDIGIGNNVINPNPDWTGVNNAGVYTSRVLQVYVLPVPDFTPPSILSAVATSDRTRALVTFSEPLADSAANPANFSINNGIVVSAAVMSNNLRQISLMVSELTVNTPYTLTAVGNICDRSPNANAIPIGTSVAIIVPGVAAQILANVPEATNFVPVLTLNIPGPVPNWNVSGTAYVLDNRTLIGSFSRVAYYMELATNNGPTNWVYVSFDPVTNDARKIGVPDMTVGAWFQQRITNANIYSSMTNITTGVFSNGCNIEFWPFDYTGATTTLIPTGSGSYDWNDTISYTYGTGGHGSMQIHNYSASNVLFALDAWGGNQTGNMSIGIGSRPTGDPDWTFAANAANFTTKNLYVLVQLANDTNVPVVTKANGGTTWSNVYVSFSKPLRDSSAAVTNFAIAGGLSVLNATLMPSYRDIMLTTSPQTPGQTYNVTINNVRDRSPNINLISNNTVATFTAFTNSLPFMLVAESTNYTLAYKLTLPGACPNYNATGVVYDVDMRPFITQSFNRVAYCMELATNAGPTNWVYASMDQFTTNTNRIGVPVLGIGAGFQQKVNNLNVTSSLASIVFTNSASGNIEFYPFDYLVGTNVAIPTGSFTNFDWNDSYSTAGQYGSMQVHNYSAIIGDGTTGQVLMAFNRWGGGQSGNTDIGIGSNLTGTNADWKFSGNGPNYTTKNLYILVQLTNAAAAPPPSTNVIAPVILLNPISRTNLLNSTNSIGALAAGTSPVYQWRKGGAPMAGQTNSWLVFNNAQLTNAGNYDVIAMNSAGAATSLVATLIINRLPVAGLPVLFGTMQNTPLEIGASNILVAASDPDGDVVGLSSAGAAFVTFTNIVITYYPPIDFAGGDSFAYVLSDSRGGFATGLVNVTVMTNHTPLVVVPPGFSNGHFRIGFSGVSNGTYTIRFTDNLMTNEWQILTNMPADAAGSFNFTDPAVPQPANRFYNASPP